MKCDLYSSIPDWLIAYPCTAELFDELGLDVSCGGKSLVTLCGERGHKPEQVLKLLHQRIQSSESDSSAD